MLIKLLGAMMIGMYLGDKGIIAFDIFTGKLNIRNTLVIIICVGLWSTFCNSLLGL